MPISTPRPSFTFTEDRLAELRAVIREAFTDGKFNSDALREALGGNLEDDGAEADREGFIDAAVELAPTLADPDEFRD